ncbi:MAG: glycosyltransferase family 1 protein [Myxococcales bacterium]|nr:glycosyltransferase family 1 protein [Myxococcales bacterium]
MTPPRALVLTLPERGHLHPLLGPAAALERSGLQVTWSTSADVRGLLAELGVTRVRLPAGVGAPPAALRGRALSETIADPQALRGWIRALLVDAPRPLVEPFRALIRELRPAVVAIDPMVYAGAIAAELEGVPWVGWSTSLNPVVPPGLRSELLSTVTALDPERHRLLEAYGLRARFRVSDVLSPWGTAVFTTEALVGPADDPTVHLVGPSRRPLGGGPLPVLPPPGEPLVYASFGSQAWHQPRRFEKLIEAARGLGIALVAAMGELAEGFRARGLPPGIQCEPFVDQPAVLERADLVVTHGGANSVMEALTAGVPLLLSPLCNDQPHDLAFIERSGAGRGIDLDVASVDEIRGALRELLADGPERAAAARIAASYRAHDGAEGAAALARSAIGTSRGSTAP